MRTVTMASSDVTAEVADAAPLRLFFFSDWRIQPVGLVEAMLEEAGVVDFVLYGGDDVRRFWVPPTIPDALVEGVLEGDLACQPPSSTDSGAVAQVPMAARHRIRTHRPDDVIALAAAILGHPPLHALQPSHDGTYSLATIVDLFRRPPEGNRLCRLAERTHFGVGGVVGNDCRAEDRSLLRYPGVRDLHTSPAEFAGWGFVGIEGAIFRAGINAMGHILHSDDSVLPHISGAVEHLGVPSRRLIILSHTPPAGCGLDVGVRFGVEHLGSLALAEYVRMAEPPLVLCGHCHSCGGKVGQIGGTLVVNAASDDTRARRARAALIELMLGKPPVVTWIDPAPHSVIFVPGVGKKTARTLGEAGITRPHELLAADNATLRRARYGPARLRKLRAYQQAVTEQRPIWLADPPALPENLLFYDVETGLNLRQVEGPWLVAALAPTATSVEQWLAIPDERPQRREMYRKFLEFIRGHPAATLCSWSGSGFDERSIAAGLTRCCPDMLPEWEQFPQLDLLTVLKRHIVMPAPDWSLKTVARWLGFPDETGDDANIDGFAVGLAYELNRSEGEPLRLDSIARYNARDVLALAHVAAWLRGQA